MFITMLIDYGRNRARLWRGKNSGEDEPCVDERRMEGQLFGGGLPFPTGAHSAGIARANQEFSMGVRKACLDRTDELGSSI